MYNDDNANYPDLNRALTHAVNECNALNQILSYSGVICKSQVANKKVCCINIYEKVNSRIHFIILSEIIITHLSNTYKCIYKIVISA